MRRLWRGVVALGVGLLLAVSTSVVAEPSVADAEVARLHARGTVVIVVSERGSGTNQRVGAVLTTGGRFVPVAGLHERAPGRLVDLLLTIPADVATAAGLARGGGIDAPHRAYLDGFAPGQLMTQGFSTTRYTLQFAASATGVTSIKVVSPVDGRIYFVEYRSGAAYPDSKAAYRYFARDPSTGS